MGMGTGRAAHTFAHIHTKKKKRLHPLGRVLKEGGAVRLGPKAMRAPTTDAHTHTHANTDATRFKFETSPVCCGWNWDDLTSTHTFAGPIPSGRARLQAQSIF